MKKDFLFLTTTCLPLEDSLSSLQYFRNNIKKGISILALATTLGWATQAFGMDEDEKFNNIAQNLGWKPALDSMRNVSIVKDETLNEYQRTVIKQKIEYLKEEVARKNPNKHYTDVCYQEALKILDRNCEKIDSQRVAGTGWGSKEQLGVLWLLKDAGYDCLTLQDPLITQKSAHSSKLLVTTAKKWALEPPPSPAALPRQQEPISAEANNPNSTKKKKKTEKPNCPKTIAPSAMTQSQVETPEMVQEQPNLTRETLTLSTPSVELTKDTEETPKPTLAQPIEPTMEELTTPPANAPTQPLTIKEELANFRTELDQLIVEKNLKPKPTPKYTESKEPEKDLPFTCRVTLGSHGFGVGSGKSKDEAKKATLINLLAHLKGEAPKNPKPLKDNNKSNPISPTPSSVSNPTEKKKPTTYTVKLPETTRRTISSAERLIAQSQLPEPKKETERTLKTKEKKPVKVENPRQTPQDSDTQPISQKQESPSSKETTNDLPRVKKETPSSSAQILKQQEQPTENIIAPEPIDKKELSILPKSEEKPSPQKQGREENLSSDKEATTPPAKLENISRFWNGDNNQQRVQGKGNQPTVETATAPKPLALKTEGTQKLPVRDGWKQALLKGSESTLKLEKFTEVNGRGVSLQNKNPSQHPRETQAQQTVGKTPNNQILPSAHDNRVSTPIAWAEIVEGVRSPVSGEVLSILPKKSSLNHSSQGQQVVETQPPVEIPLDAHSKATGAPKPLSAPIAPSYNPWYLEQLVVQLAENVMKLGEEIRALKGQDPKPLSAPIAPSYNPGDLEQRVKKLEEENRNLKRQLQEQGSQEVTVPAEEPRQNRGRTVSAPAHLKHK